MGQTFDRVAIALTPRGTEYIVLEALLMEDFGQGQGPKGGVVTVKEGWVAVRGSGAGEARLYGGFQEQGGNVPPRLTLMNAQGDEAVEIAAYADPSGQPSTASIYLEAADCNAWLGGNGADGDLVLLPSYATKHEAGQAAIHLSGEDRLVRIGTFSGFATKEEIRLDGQGHRVQVSGPDPSDDSGLGPNVARVVLDATEAGLLQLRGPDGTTLIELRAGPQGRLELRDAGGTKLVELSAATHGLVELRDKAGTRTIQLKAETGAGRFGGQGVDGDLLVFSKDATSQASDQASVWVKGGSGDIVLRNADCAEEFELAPGVDVEAGTVLVIDRDGLLGPSEEPYDRSVAGVASGADGTRPGIILGHRPGERSRRLAVALAGRVGCRVDAGYSPIDVGDLLTTSATRGHAMKAEDPSRAFGAVVGKALGSVRTGRSVIPILVSLQ